MKEIGFLLTAKDMASGTFGKVRSEVAGLGTASRTSSFGVRTLHEATGRLSSGLGSVKAHLGGLISGPLGILGLGGGLLSLGGIIEGSLHKTSEFALTLERLTALTGESAQSMGELSIVADKFGVDSTRLSQIVGFTEKTLGRLGQTSAKAGDGLKKAQEGVTKASERLHVARLKLNEVESKGTASASQLAAAENRVKDAEVALNDARNKLSNASKAGIAPTSKLIELGRQYGVQLTDNRGKALSFSQVLNNVSDYYTGNASAADKAALAAQIFGRGYAAMIPILQLGSKGIAEQKQTVADLGLQLGTDSQGALQAYKQSMRQMDDAINVTQISLGLGLAPTVTKVANAISHWVETGGTKPLIAGITAGVENAYKFGVAVANIFQQAIGAWNQVPPELRDFLVKAFIAGKVSKFLLGFGALDVAKIGLGIGRHFLLATAGKVAGDTAGGVAGALAKAGIGKAFVQPVFVTNPGFGAAGAAEGALAGGAKQVPMLGNNFASIIAKSIVGAIAVVGGDLLIGAGAKTGGPGGAAEAAAGGGAMIAGGALIAGPLGAIAGSIAAVVVTQQKVAEQNSAIGADIHKTSAAFLAQRPNDAALTSSLAGINQGINDIQANPLNVLVAGDALDHLRTMRDDTEAQMRSNSAISERMANIADYNKGTLSNTASIPPAIKALHRPLDALHKDLQAQRHTLHQSTDPAKIAAAAKAIARDVMKGAGSVGGTEKLISELRHKLSNTHDPQLQAVLKAAIHTVASKLPERRWISGILEKETRLVSEAQKGGLTAKEQKALISRLQKDEATFLARGDTHAAEKVAKRISSLQGALEHKKMGVSVTAVANVSIREILGKGVVYNSAAGSASQRVYSI